MGGTTSTHVANGTNQSIYVKVDAERAYLLASEFTSSSSIGFDGASASNSQSKRAQWDWHKIQRGFTRINRGKFLRFDVDTTNTSTVYITIITERGECIANALQRKDDKSIIVHHDYSIKDARHGTIWQAERKGCMQSSRKMAERNRY